jgi:hypothetical protein
MTNNESLKKIATFTIFFALIRLPHYNNDIRKKKWLQRAIHKSIIGFRTTASG